MTISFVVLIYIFIYLQFAPMKRWYMHFSIPACYKLVAGAKFVGVSAEGEIPCSLPNLPSRSYRPSLAGPHSCSLLGKVSRYKARILSLWVGRGTVPKSWNRLMGGVN